MNNALASLGYQDAILYHSFMQNTLDFNTSKSLLTQMLEKKKKTVKCLTLLEFETSSFFAAY